MNYIAVHHCWTHQHINQTAPLTDGPLSPEEADSLSVKRTSATVSVRRQGHKITPLGLDSNRHLTYDCLWGLHRGAPHERPGGHEEWEKPIHCLVKQLIGIIAGQHAPEASWSVS